MNARIRLVPVILGMMLGMAACSSDEPEGQSLPQPPVAAEEENSEKLPSVAFEDANARIAVVDVDRGTTMPADVPPPEVAAAPEPERRVRTYSTRDVREGVRHIREIPEPPPADKIGMMDEVARAPVPASADEPPSVYAVQGEQGRFIKMDAKGRPLPASANEWACVQDRKTGLIWEAKTRGTLRHAMHAYVHIGDVAACPFPGCSVDAYVKLVNDGRLCGRSTWRLPRRVELVAIVNHDHAPDAPSIDVRFHPHTMKGRYWTSSTFEHDASRMWTVNFADGYDVSQSMDKPAHLMLVSE